MDSIVLRDRNGKEINYHGIDYLNVNTPDGETQGYAAYDPETLVPENLVSGVVVGDVEGALEVPQAVETTIDPDFKAGNMEVVPADGQVFSKVGVLKPANLTPENIAKDVDIAGIIGTLAAGGGGFVKCGIITPGKVTSKIITHDLGVVPDIFILSVFKSVSSSDAIGIYSMWAVSEAFAEANSMARYGMYLWKYNTSTIYYYANANPLDSTNAITGLHSATATQITAQGNGSAYPLQDAPYLWVAIGGLT